MTPIEPILPVILGPTASGKSALALDLAQRLGAAEIVSCDSVAVFRGFELGTAKPTRVAQEEVPHHLLDVAEAGDVFTAGDYARKARAALAEITKRGKTAIVVGGTGLYLRALFDGLFAGPPRSETLRERLRARAEERGTTYLYAVLSRMDKAAAAGIHANDNAKLIRAIEVCLAAKTQMSELWKTGRDPLQGY